MPISAAPTPVDATISMITPATKHAEPTMKAKGSEEPLGPRRL